MTACLLIVDLANDFLDHLPPERVERLVENTNDLVAHFRTLGLPIVWVRQEFAADLSDAYLEMRKREIRTVIAGTIGAQLHPRLDVASEDLVIVKKRYSAFFGTALDRELQASGTTQLIVAGINTHACIRTTAIDAYQRDLEVLLATDCLDSYDVDHAAVSLAYMDGKIASSKDNGQLKRLFPVE